MIDDVGQMLAQSVQQFLARQTALRHQAVDLVGAKCVGQIARRDLLVWSRAHPGIGGIAVTILLELLEQVAQSAAEDAACCTSGKDATEKATETSTTKAPAAQAAA